MPGARVRFALFLAAAALIVLTAQPALAALNGGRPVNPPPGQGAAVIAHTNVASAHKSFGELLSLVPDTEANRAWLSYGDVAAWHEATGVARVAGYDALKQLPDADRQAWLRRLTEQTGPPAALGIQYLATQAMRPVYGFDFFDVAQMLEAGELPGNLTYVNLNVASEEIAAALAAAGYTAEPLETATLYSRGDDYGVDMAAETHLAQLGILNRIALLDGDEPGSQLLIARATAPLTQSLAAAAGDSPSLYEDRTYRALADALEYEGLLPGQLVNLIVPAGGQFQDPAAALTPSDALDSQLARYANDPLPPYRLNAFATNRDGANTYLTVLLALGPTGDTSESAAILGNRLGNYVSVVNGESLGDQWDVQVTGAFESAARIAYVTLKLKPDSTLSWMDLIARRDLLFLTTE